MFILIFLAEITLFLIFFLIILRFFKEKKEKEIIFLFLPLILFEFFIELMSIKSGKFINNSLYDKFLIFGVSMGALIFWATGFYVATLITDKIFLEKSLPILILSISDALIITLGNLIINPLGLKIGWWSYGNYNYLIKGNFFGVPVWEFIGCFFGMFIFSFIYRKLKDFPFKKRFFLGYGFVFWVVLVRFFVYNILRFF